MKETELTAAIVAAQKEYHEQSDKLTAPELANINDEITSMKKGLSDLISKGAVVCPECGDAPVGMKKARGVYEIGCTSCKPVETEAGTILFAAQGETAEEAVENWNKKEFRIKPLEQK